MISHLASLPDHLLFSELADGLDQLRDSAVELHGQACFLAQAHHPRGSWILNQAATEEASKFLMLVDAARCPRNLLSNHLCNRKFYDHLARGIYAKACGWRPGSFGELRTYVERERQSHHLDGPNGFDWIYRNSLLEERENTMYVDYPDERTAERGFLGNITDDVNRNYWRELADYTLTRRSLAPIGFAATNVSAELAKNVRLEINQPKNSGAGFIDDLPDFPRHNRGALFVPSVSLNSMLNPPKGALKLLDHDDRWTLTVDFGDIQPKATSWAADPVYVSARAEGFYSLSLKIYADNLSEPQDAEIQLEFAIEQRSRLTIENLRQIQDEYWMERKRTG